MTTGEEPKRGERRRREAAQRRWWLVPLYLILALFVSALSLGVGLLWAIAAKSLWSEGPVAVDQTVIDLTKALAWPLVVLAAAAFFAFSGPIRRSFDDLLRRMTSISGAGYEVVFSAGGAQKLKREVEDTIEEFERQAALEFQRMARSGRIPERLRRVMQNFCATAKKQEKIAVRLGDLRATVHVRDVAFEDSLYQLVDYVPSGGGRGRRYSMRYGAIGLAWRLGEDQVWIEDEKLEEEQLIRQWGMTSAEASRSIKKSFGLSIVLRDDLKDVIGILYIDAEKASSVTGKTTHDEQEEVAKKLLAHFIKAETDKSLKDLAAELKKIDEELSKSATWIEIHE